MSENLVDLRLNDTFFDNKHVTYAIKSDGTVTAWGTDYYDLDSEQFISMTKQTDSLYNIQRLISGFDSTVALRSDRIFFWGRRNHGHDIIEKTSGYRIADVWSMGGNFVTMQDDRSVIVSTAC